ncbi:MAG: hypothetical protein ACREV5_07160 [Steroidobacter sp.]
MELRPLLIGFLGLALYPAWLAAGALDYYCHRRTDIEHTSGPVESWLHVAQFICIAMIIAFAMLVEITLTVWIVMLVVALTHSTLAFIDVSYTDKRRWISPLEQLAHGFLDVIPLMTVGLLGVMSWAQLKADAGAFALYESIAPGVQAWVLASFGVLAGGPILEELLRSLRARREWGANSVNNPLVDLSDRRASS